MSSCPIYLEQICTSKPGWVLQVTKVVSIVLAGILQRNRTSGLIYLLIYYKGLAYVIMRSD